MWYEITSYNSTKANKLGQNYDIDSKIKNNAYILSNFNIT